MGKEIEDIQLNGFHYTLAGSTSGIVARCFGQPLDVLKIRFQVQNIEDGKLKYNGVFSATKLIVKEEGIIGLWKGHVPAQVLSVIYGAVQFSTYEHLKSTCLRSIPKSRNPDRWMPVINFMSGGSAGLLASFICQPIDVIRTRFIAQLNANQTYTSISHAVSLMLKENGIRTFYKGVIPNLLMIFPYCGFQFCFYGTFKTVWETLEFSENSKMKYLTCGCLSGMCSKVMLLPLDNAKKRLQVQGLKGYNMHGGMFDILKYIVHQQGFKGLYQGAVPSVFKAIVTTGVSFFIYEQSCDFIRQYKRKQK